MVKLSSSEEENTEFLSSLWDKYKFFILIGISALIAGIIGWESWTKAKAKDNQIVSDLYENFIENSRNTKTDLDILAKEIIEGFPDSLYADLVTFHLAKLEVDKDNFFAAEQLFLTVLKKHSSSWKKDFDPIELAARQRLARVLVADNRPQEAIDLINEAESLNNSLYETKGDAELRLGLLKEARLSYLKAIETTQNQSIKSIIQMKLADIEKENSR